MYGTDWWIGRRGGILDRQSDLMTQVDGATAAEPAEDNGEPTN
jgi:hypothetical protein